MRQSLIFRCFICKDCLLQTYKGPNKQETKWVESALHFEVLEMVITAGIESRSRGAGWPFATV